MNAKSTVQFLRNRLGDWLSKCSDSMLDNHTRALPMLRSRANGRATFAIVGCLLSFGFFFVIYPLLMVCIFHIIP